MQIISEADHLFSLLLQVRSVVPMAHLHDSGCRRWGQQRLLELDLVKQKLIGFEGGQLVLSLHVKEVFSRNWLIWIGEESLDQLGCGGCSSRSQAEGSLGAVQARLDL